MPAAPAPLILVHVLPRFLRCLVIPSLVLETRKRGETWTATVLCTVDRCPYSSISEVGSESWRDYFEDFVIGGNNAEANEKSGALVFLSPSLKGEILRIGFFNMGVFRMTPDRFVANEDKIRNVSFELYCERMELIYPAQ